MKPPLAPSFFAPRRSLASDGEVHPQSQPHGFSLVEVVLALGICSFVLITVMGLMAVALQSSKQAVQITQSGKLVQAVSTHLLQSGYSNLTQLPSGASSPKWEYNYEGEESVVEAEKYYVMQAVPSVGLRLPGAPADNSNIMRFKIITTTPDKTTITNMVTVADTGY